MSQSPLLHIVLFEPEIPPNTGNIMRLCHNTGAMLHLIEPLGFAMDTKKLRRAGLDYLEWQAVQIHQNIDDFWSHKPHGRCFACTTKSSTHYSNIAFQEGDILFFGPETRGLPDTIRNHPRMHQRLRIPMRQNSRSLNLSNSVAVITYEALRQMQFEGLC